MYLTLSNDVQNKPIWLYYKASLDKCDIFAKRFTPIWRMWKNYGWLLRAGSESSKPKHSVVNYTFGKIWYQSVEAVQRKAARFTVQDYRYSSSVTAMLSHLTWLLLKDRRNDIRLALLFQIIRGKISAEAENILLKPDSRTRKKHNSTYRHLRPHTEQYRQSFFVTTIIDWNNLSEVNADTMTAYKAQLRPLPHPYKSQRYPPSSAWYS